MAKTLLNGVNELLQRVNKLDNDAGLLTSLTDSARQYWIDVAVQVLNETVDQAYENQTFPKPSGFATDNVTLATGTRAYTLASDLVSLRTGFHLYDTTNNHYIAILQDDGYERLLESDPEEDDTGLAWAAALRPTDGKLCLNRTPTATENGRVYRYYYEKDTVLSAAADVFPFTDEAFRAMIPAAAHLWRRDVEIDFDPAIFRASMGRFIRLIRQHPPRQSWTPPRVTQMAGTAAPFDP